MAEIGRKRANWLDLGTLCKHAGITLILRLNTTAVTTVDVHVV